MISVGPVSLIGQEQSPKLLMQPHMQAAAPHPTLTTVIGCKSVCKPVTGTTIPLLGGLCQRGSLVLCTQEQQ